MKLWNSSITARLITLLAALYQNSITCSCLTGIASAAKNSRTAYNIGTALSAPPVEQTLYMRLLEKLNAFLYRAGALADKSLTVCLLRAAGRAVWHVLRGSLILRSIARLGIRRWLLLTFAFMLPLDILLRAAPLPSIIPSLWDEALLVLMFIYALYEVSKSKLTPRVTPVDAPLMFFVGVGVLLILTVSPDLAIAVEGFRAVFQYMFFFFALVRLVKNEGDFNLILTVILGTGVILALHGIYQYITAAPIPTHWVSMAEAGVRSRAFSIVGSPNILGDFMVMTAPLAVGMVYRSKALRSKIFFWGCFAVICLCCLVTFSRGSWIGLAAAAVVFSLLVDRRLLALLITACVAALFVPDVSNRLMFLFTPEFQASSEASGRSMRWEYGIELLTSMNTFLGVGLGGFGGAVAMHNQVMPGVKYFYIDNYYIKTLVETGILGIVSYAALLLSTLWMGLRSQLRCVSKNTKISAAAILAAMTGVLTHCVFENIFEVPYMNAYFWAYAALLACCGFVWRRGERNEQA